MSVGAKWRRRAEQAAAARVVRLLDAAEREINEVLIDARIERGADALRIRGQRLVQRWLSEPLLRFLAWRIK